MHLDIFALLILGLVASAGVYTRGHRILGAIMAITCIFSASWPVYLAYHGFHTQDMESVQIAIRISGVFSFIYAICVAIACWLPKPPASAKSSENP